MSKMKILIFLYFFTVPLKYGKQIWQTKLQHTVAFKWGNIDGFIIRGEVTQQLILRQLSNNSPSRMNPNILGISLNAKRYN